MNWRKEKGIKLDTEKIAGELFGLSRPLLDWFDRCARILPWRDIPTPYRVWISEIMLQQTRVSAVLPYFERFLTVFPDLYSLSRADDETLFLLWEGLGYYNRARNLKKAANMVLSWGLTDLPNDYEALLKLPGIGEYTAGAIASIAYGIPVAAIDGNVLRVLSRMTQCEYDIGDSNVKKAYRKIIELILPKDRAGDFNQALMELGAVVCVPNGAPKCEICPMQSLCLGYLNDNAQSYPVKAQKKPRRIENRTICVLISGEYVYLKKRPDKGLLAGLWEFVNIEGHLNEDELNKNLMHLDIQPINFKKLSDAKHIFSHVEWHMKGYFVFTDRKNKIDGGIWVKYSEIKEKCALPSAYKAYEKALFDYFLIN